MRITRNLEFQSGSTEEKLPYRTPGFPYLASRAELDYFREPFVPWHWHHAVELFYVESGEVAYHTPGRTLVFPAGSAGMVNSDVLHMTKIQAHSCNNVQLLHIFDPELLSGCGGSVIEQKYIRPVTDSSQLEILILSPGEPEQMRVIELICKAFRLPEEEFGYEIRIREALSQIWLRLFQLYLPLLRETSQPVHRADDKLKQMMLYIQEHYSEKIFIPELARTVFLSERECYRVFQEHLHMTPAAYIKSCRIQAARRMLTDSRLSITEIAYACGLANASYFGKIFRETMGEAPLQYRLRWQDRDKK